MFRLAHGGMGGRSDAGHGGVVSLEQFRAKTPRLRLFAMRDVRRAMVCVAGNTGSR
jgi:hypothetical protein